MEAVVQHDERRECPRINAQWLQATVVKKKGWFNKREPVRVVDLSASGIGLLVRDLELAPGTELLISLHYAAHDRQGVVIDENRLEGVVRNAVALNGLYRCGIEFQGDKTLSAVEVIVNNAAIASPKKFV